MKAVEPFSSSLLCYILLRGVCLLYILYWMAGKGGGGEGRCVKGVGPSLCLRSLTVNLIFTAGDGLKIRKKVQH